MTDTTEITGAEILSILERYETLDAEKKQTTELQKDVMAEAKGRGFDTKILKKLIQIRKKEAAVIAEEEAILELYKNAIGME